MGRYNINPKTKLAVRDAESDLPVEAFHGRLHSFLMAMIPIFRLIFNVKKPIDIQNIPDSGGLVIVSNHTRWSNAFVSQTVIKRPLYYFGKAELLKWPIIGRFVMSLGSIPVDRSVHNSKALDYAVKHLKNGGVMIIFAEGFCNRSQKLAPLKFGAVSIASKTKVPIIPMAIWKGKTRFGEPMKVGKDLETANNELYRRISTMRQGLMKKR